MRKLLLFALLPLFASAAEQKPKPLTEAQCAAIHSFNLKQRAENRGLKETELEGECPAPKPRKSVTRKK